MTVEKDNLRKAIADSLMEFTDNVNKLTSNELLQFQITKLMLNFINNILEILKIDKDVEINKITKDGL